MSGDRLTELAFYLSIACAATYVTLFFIIVSQSKFTSNRMLAFSCLTTAVWALSSLWSTAPLMYGWIGFLDIARMLCWYSYILVLYRKSAVAPKWHAQTFLLIALGCLVVSIWNTTQSSDPETISIFSGQIILRLFLAVCELLLIENLYLNLPEHARWHVALPCILLGALTCLDIFMAADAVLFHRPSVVIAGVRVVILLMIAPLLVLAALRGQKWTEPVRLSKTAVFHSATLVLSGMVLLALGVFGELFRSNDKEIGWVIELSLLCAGLIAIAIILSSRSARAMMQRVVLYHFFADRFDYRLQWLRCIATLSGTATSERTTLSVRSIRAVADIVDSPSGALFLYDRHARTMNWAGSWNMDAPTIAPLNQATIDQLVSDERVIELALACANEVYRRQGAWLAVPLLHVSGVIGVVLVGRPRTQYRLDQEVFDLLRILGREVATHIVEQRATESLHQVQALKDYGNRFAFVAHDIKNIASQLGLLVQNSATYLSDPEFQADMVETVKSSVQKIDGLLKRLDQPSTTRSLSSLAAAPWLEAFIATYARVRQVNLIFQQDGSSGEVAISPSSLEMAVTHLLNNAVEAAPGQPIEIAVTHQAEKVVISIRDHGAGMSPTFIHEQLFTPLKTSKGNGSGLGAYQARELIQEVGGSLKVFSALGIGTTMQIELGRSDSLLRSRVSDTPAFSAAG